MDMNRIMQPQLVARNITIHVNKIKGHITEADVEAGYWKSYERCGNNHADRLAGLGAASTYDKLHLVGGLSAAHWSGHVDKIDAQCYLTIHRLLAVARRKLADREKCKPPLIQLGIRRDLV